MGGQQSTHRNTTARCTFCLTGRRRGVWIDVAGATRPRSPDSPFHTHATFLEGGRTRRPIGCFASSVRRRGDHCRPASRMCQSMRGARSSSACHASSPPLSSPPPFLPAACRLLPALDPQQWGARRRLLRLPPIEREAGASR
jgi:hypothetical protein